MIIALHRFEQRPGALALSAEQRLHLLRGQ